ncbi:flagellar motor switch protein FliN/FliY [Anaerosporobacter mobilis DSM 15930]|jgi:flagellar motor switch protein FliN/FliY|uniref:Flagellar motor switch protein FliN/FliY n=1 Tax=Anaerosporobacter mobilis DSM 15930 TaxID=1120996 RepID=A0A1M7EXF4_9FIRM|nr:flagellar motor switch phosphatase FliY [Anaerosporobacter mobilis]SHL96452.1 flagellar motor switch protein FliN/FliY [Anaerosporobacter mobilis DSM 15930]
MDGMLSQEEINALLGSIDNMDSSANGTASSSSDSLTADEKDAVGEISNISMGTAATTLSTLVNNKVVITTPVVSYSTWDNLSQEFGKPCVFIQISYKEGLDGNNILILKESDVKIITDLMMGGEGINVDGELSELHLSAIGEAMNQMMGSAATSLSSMLEKKVDISPPVASLVDLNSTINEAEISDFLKQPFVKVAFKMEIGDLVDSQIMQLYPFDFARDLYRKFSESGSNSEEQQASSVEQPVQQEQQLNQQTIPVQPMTGGQPMMGQPMMGQPMPGYGTIPMYQGQMPYTQPAMGQMMPMQDVNVQPAQFQAFNNNAAQLPGQENIDLIMDVPLEVTVELGRTNKSIKEILDFTPGTIIELNKLAGEPIDVLVNGKFVAKGEVVVIEECFGIRVTEIVK